MTNVAIFGCGPSGLMAAHACHLSGVSFDIYSKKRKSQLYGSQYLHEPIPEVTNYEDHVMVKYVTIGTPEEYRRKVHGKWWDGMAAPEEFEPDHLAWNIRHAYDVLWQKYGNLVNDYEFGIKDKPPHFPSSFVPPIFPSPFVSSPTGYTAYTKTCYDLDLKKYDLIISTVPRTIWKIHGEEYIYSEGWALGDAPEEGRFIPYACEDNHIICDGTPETSWTRLSRVFGYGTVEWPHHAQKPPLPGVSMVIKPLRYREPFHGENPTKDWLHVGRYGEWKKGVVVTDAFFAVMNKLKEMGQ